MTAASYGSCVITDQLPPVPPAPRPRLGRRVRRDARRLALTLAALAAATGALFVVDGVRAGGIAIVVTLLVAIFGAGRLFGSHDEDVLEDIWLRSALAGLRAPADPDEADGSDDLYIA